MIRDPNAEPVCILDLRAVLSASLLFVVAGTGAALAMCLLFGFDWREVLSSVSAAGTGFGLALWLLAREGRWL